MKKRVKELVSTDVPDLWKTIKDGVLKACGEVCGKKSTRDQKDMWWWNEEVKDTIARKKAAFKELCRFPSEENKTQYKRKRNQTRKIVARAMRMEAEEELNNLYQNSNRAFCFLRRMKKGRIWKDKSAYEEEMDDWVLLKKIGQQFGRNMWKRA